MEVGADTHRQMEVGVGTDTQLTKGKPSFLASCIAHGISVITPSFWLSLKYIYIKQWPGEQNELLHSDFFQIELSYPGRRALDSSKQNLQASGNK